MIFKRGIDPGPPNGSRQLAETDSVFFEYVYNDTSGSLSVGMPLYVDVTDAGEYNSRYASTALASMTDPLTGLTVPPFTTGGRVVLGTNANAVNLCCVGVYAPENPAASPKQYDVIRVCSFGRAQAQVVSKNGGTAVLVGDYLVSDTTPGANAISGHNTAVVGKTIGIALATRTALTAGASIVAIPGSGSAIALVNAFIELN